MLRMAVPLLCAMSSLHVLSGQTGGVTGNAAPFAATFEALKQVLGLTASQVQKLQELQRERTLASQTLYQQLAVKQQQLNALLNAPGADPAAVGQLSIEVAGLRRRSPQAQSMGEKARAVLDASQTAKLPLLENALQLQRAANEAVDLGLIVYEPVH